MGFSL